MVEHPAGKTTWPELFFDLGLVLLVNRLSSFLEETPNLEHLALMGLLAMPIWLSWCGITFLASRFSPRSHIERLLFIIATVFAVVLATSLSAPFTTKAAVFSVGYAGIRWCLVILYRVADRRTGNSLAHFYTYAFAIGATCWTVAIFVPGPTRFILWGLGVAADAIVPFWAGRRGLLKANPVNPRQFPDRFGLIVIIALGEGGLCIGGAITSLPFDMKSVLPALVAIWIVAAIFWRYFAPFEPEEEEEERHAVLGGPTGGRIARDLFSFGHYPAFFGIVTASAGIKIFLGALDDSDLTRTGVELVAIGIVSFLATVTAVDIVLWDRRLGWRHSVIIPITLVCMVALISWPLVLMVVLASCLSVSALLSGEERLALLKKAHVSR